MNHVNLLCQTLKPHLKWHGARLSFLAQSHSAQIVSTRFLACWERICRRHLPTRLRGDLGQRVYPHVLGKLCPKSEAAQFGSQMRLKPFSRYATASRSRRCLRRLATFYVALPNYLISGKNSQPFGLIYSTILVQAVTPLRKARSKINRRRYMVRMTLPKARKA